MLWFNIIYANITQTFIRKLGLLGQIYWRRFYLAFRVNLIFIFYTYCEKSKFEVSKTPSRLSWKVFPIFVFLVDITHHSEWWEIFLTRSDHHITPAPPTQKKHTTKTALGDNKRTVSMLVFYIEKGEMSNKNVNLIAVSCKCIEFRRWRSQHQTFTWEQTFTTPASCQEQSSCNSFLYKI